jgi:hypothetical protein
MDGLNSFIKSSENSDWFNITCDLGKLSSSILINDRKNIENYLIKVFHHTFALAKLFNIDLEKAWLKWNKKAQTKKYSRPYGHEVNILYNNGSSATTNKSTIKSFI